jgi:hypothetical protein
METPGHGLHGNETTHPCQPRCSLSQWNNRLQRCARGSAITLSSWQRAVSFCSYDASGAPVAGAQAQEAAWVFFSASFSCTCGAGEDQLVGSTVVGHARVVVPAEDVGRFVQRMVADRPAALSVAIHLAYAGVDADAYCANQCCLTQVGAEAGPEVVVDVRSAMERPRVDREPMTDVAKETDHQSDDEDYDDDADHPGNFVPRAGRVELRRRHRLGIGRDRSVAALCRSGEGFGSRGRTRWLGHGSPIPLERPGKRVLSLTRPSTGRSRAAEKPASR